MPEYKLPSKSTIDAAKGSLLSVTHHPDGTSLVKLDNGPTMVINIITLGSDLPTLLNTDLKEIQEHLMTRRPGHFRKKRGKK